jgi:hypothetical protein
MLTYTQPIVTPWEALSVKTEDPWCVRSHDLLQDHMVARDQVMQDWIDTVVAEATDVDELCVCDPGYKGATISALLSMPEEDLLSIAEVKDLCYWYV